MKNYTVKTFVKGAYIIDVDTSTVEIFDVQDEVAMRLGFKSFFCTAVCIGMTKQLSDEDYLHMANTRDIIANIVGEETRRKWTKEAIDSLRARGIKVDASEEYSQEAEDYAAMVTEEEAVVAFMDAMTKGKHHLLDYYRYENGGRA